MIRQLESAPELCHAVNLCVGATDLKQQILNYLKQVIKRLFSRTPGSAKDPHAERERERLMKAACEAYFSGSDKTSRVAAWKDETGLGGSQFYEYLKQAKDAGIFDDYKAKIEAALQEFQTKAQKLGEAVYKEQQAEAGAPGGADAPGGGPDPTRGSLMQIKVQGTAAAPELVAGWHLVTAGGSATSPSISASSSSVNRVGTGVVIRISIRDG